MSKSKAMKVKWTADASDDDYRAAEVYLSLLMTTANAAKTVGALKSAAVDKYKASDLLRASQVTLPKSDDRPCRREIKKIENGEALSPVLLMRDAAQKQVVIADGFHRICAAYRIDPDVILDCKIA